MVKKLIVVALLALLFVHVIKAQRNECNYNNAIDPACHKDTPYCYNDDYRRCVECMNDCDCGFNEYCSRGSFNIGDRNKCVKFKKAGKSCLPYSSSAITNKTIDEKSKCAMLLLDAVGEIVVDHQGSCIGGKCRMCTPSSSVSCSSPGYLGEPRMCARPGTEVSVTQYEWAPSEYGKNPIHVWLAIFFVFIFIMLLALLIMAFSSFRK